MYAVDRSSAVRRRLSRLQPTQLAQYAEIELHVCQLFDVLLRDGRLVTRARLYDIDGYRYFDNEFPFMIFFERVGAPRYQELTLVIRALLAATPNSPRK